MQILFSDYSTVVLTFQKHGTQWQENKTQWQENKWQETFANTTPSDRLHCTLLKHSTLE